MPKAYDDDTLKELQGTRYRVLDREGAAWYVVISTKFDKPVEVFATSAADRDYELQSSISNMTTITRLMSLILRHIVLNEPLTLESMLTQLTRSSRNKNDVPDILFKVLTRHMEATDA